MAGVDDGDVWGAEAIDDGGEAEAEDPDDARRMDAGMRVLENALARTRTNPAAMTLGGEEDLAVQDDAAEVQAIPEAADSDDELEAEAGADPAAAAADLDDAGPADPEQCMILQNALENMPARGEALGEVPFMHPHPDDAPRRHIVAAYQERIDQPIGEKCRKTLRQFLKDVVLQLKLKSSPRARAMDNLLTALKATLPEKNLCPASFHLVSGSKKLPSDWAQAPGSCVLTSSFDYTPMALALPCRCVEFWVWTLSGCMTCTYATCARSAYINLRPRANGQPCTRLTRKLPELGKQALRQRGHPVSTPAPSATLGDFAGRKYQEFGIAQPTHHTWYEQGSVNADTCCCATCLRPSFHCNAACATQRVYYIPLKQALLDANLKCPSFCAALGRHRTPNDRNTFWGSPEFERLHRITGLGRDSTSGPLPHDVLAISLGGDFFQPFETKQHSTGIVCVRYAGHLLLVDLRHACTHWPRLHKSLLFANRIEDVDPDRVYRRVYHAVPLIIPPVQLAGGKTCEPDNLDGHMLPLVQELQRCGPPPFANTSAIIDRVATDELSVPKEEIGMCIAMNERGLPALRLLTVRHFPVRCSIHHPHPLLLWLYHTQGKVWMWICTCTYHLVTASMPRCTACSASGYTSS